MVEDFLQEQLYLMVELLDDAIEISDTQQMSEFVENISVLSWIETGLLQTLKILNLEEDLLEEVMVGHIVEVYVQHSLKRLVALGVLAHGSIVNWISSVFVLNA